MKLSRRFIYSFLFIFIFLFIVLTYELPYYIYKPGHTTELEDVVEVEHGYENKGTMQLVTVSGGRATPIDYLWTRFLNYHEFVPIEDARPDGMTDEQYMNGQLYLMESSQQASTIVAYKAANKSVTINHKGIRVLGVVEDMSAAGVVQFGDVITKVDDQHIKEADDLIQYVEEKEAGDHVQLTIKREDKTLERELILQSFPDDDSKIGIGIQLVTEREISVDPPISFDSGKIGGPSAGLMFSLEIYNQLTEDDVTKGYNVIGTGEVDFEGNVRRIGGVDKKVVAAHKSGGDIFFVPNEGGHEESNYNEAKKVAEDIQTEMKIVAIDHFDDALEYLRALE